MSTSEEVRFSLTVITNKEKTKVLFAVIDNNLADVLLSFLTLPLGVIPQLLQKHYGDQAPRIGSLNTLYKGLANLDSEYFWTQAGKLMLLNPRSSFDRLKLMNIYDNQSAMYFACESKYCRSTCLNLYHDTGRCSCGKSMNREIDMENSIDEAFTVETMNFLISDNLHMLHNVTSSIIKAMKNMGITDSDGIEQMTVTIGFNEIVDLFKGSLFSQTPLTDLILGKRLMHTTIKCESISLPPELKKGTTCSSKKMKVKAMIQRSTNKFLFVEAEEDFLELIFSFLTIPLGKVEFLLDNNTSLGSIDNLYGSLPNLKYQKTPLTLNRLLNPELPPMYISTNQIFPLTEQTPDIHYDYPYTKDGYMEFAELCLSLCKAQIMDPKGHHNTYIKGPRMFMITDDLNVTPFGVLSSLSTLKQLKIPLSDVEEIELHIGLEEGLSILKASLNSTSALTNGLSHILKKQPKQEH